MQELNEEDLEFVVGGAGTGVTFECTKEKMVQGEMVKITSKVPNVDPAKVEAFLAKKKNLGYECHQI